MSVLQHWVYPQWSNIAKQAQGQNVMSFAFVSSSCRKASLDSHVLYELAEIFVANFQKQDNFYIVVFQWKHCQSWFLLEQRLCFSVQDPCSLCHNWGSSQLSVQSVWMCCSWAVLQHCRTRTAKECSSMLQSPCFIVQSYFLGHWTTKKLVARKTWVS